MGRRGKPREVFVVDCETDPFLYGREPKPFIWGCYSEKTGFQTFEDAEGLLQFLYDRRAVVFAHNGGRFDFLFLQDFLVPWSGVRIINGRVSSFKINDCIFRDSFLILPTALKSYKKERIDYSIFEKSERDRPENRARIIDYLEKDCRYLHELVLGFVGTMERVLPWPVPPSRFSRTWVTGPKFQKPVDCSITASNLFTMGDGFHASR